MNKYKAYIELTDFFLESCYDIVYKMHIMPYSSDGAVPSQDELESLQRDFIKLFYQKAGKKIISNLLTFFGNESTLHHYILSFFNFRRSQDVVLDSIRKTETE